MSPVPITATVKLARSISYRHPDEWDRSSANSLRPGMRGQTEPVGSRAEVVENLRLPTIATLPVEPARKKRTQVAVNVAGCPGLV